MSAGSAGSDGVPTRLRRYMSQCTVAAPAARDSVATPVPPVATTIPGLAKRSRQNVTEPSAKSIQTGAECGSPQEIAAAPVPDEASRTAAQAEATNARASVLTALDR